MELDVFYVRRVIGLCQTDCRASFDENSSKLLLIDFYLEIDNLEKLEPIEMILQH